MQRLFHPPATTAVGSEHLLLTHTKLSGCNTSIPSVSTHKQTADTQFLRTQMTSTSRNGKGRYKDAGNERYNNINHHNEKHERWHEDQKRGRAIKPKAKDESI